MLNKNVCIWSKQAAPVDLRMCYLLVMLYVITIQILTDVKILHVSTMGHVWN